MKKKSNNMEQLGVLFSNVSEKTGTTYFSGNFDGEKVVGFLNEVTTKDGRETTVINIYKSLDLEGSAGKTTAKKKTTTNKKTLPF